MLVGLPEGRRPLGKPRRGSKDNIKMGLGEVGWGDMDWIDLAQDKGSMAGYCDHVDEPSVSIKYLEILE
jgi:hypothetical protein